MATNNDPIRYAVVGLGYIAQAAVLPAFEHAENSRLAALVSDDPEKLKQLGERYGVEHRFSYGEYEECLGSGLIDAVYIALPNSMHHEYTVRAARAGIHVLCEKPMAVDERECREMIEACRENNVRLMIAYRLHFEEANLTTKALVEEGRLGTPRIFNSVFTMQVKEGNIRLQQETGGGTLYDIGIYAINAARTLFAAEPIEVIAVTEKGDDPRFEEVEEMTGAILRFPDHRLATFICSFGAKDTSTYEVIGTRGRIRLDPGYELAEDLHRYTTMNGSTREETFSKRDQFAPEIIYFSDCIREGINPQPSGAEGLADVAVIRALYGSARSGRPMHLTVPEPTERPEAANEMKKPPVEKQQLIHANAPTEAE
ncbi:MAG TPA: Gfo/Idh/MocA family oxidoreductase [Candidatus Kapabacteria bacterium]|nr:Gfo/Idh/MocA family oxidoreductase [Candidatus Kapabacteria bacterium]